MFIPLVEEIFSLRKLEFGIDIVKIICFPSQASNLTDLFKQLRKRNQSRGSINLEIMSMSKATGFLEDFKGKKCHPLIRFKTKKNFVKFRFFKALDF